MVTTTVLLHVRGEDTYL